MAWTDLRTTILLRLAGLAALAMLSGCTVVSGPRASPLPTGGPTMADIYRSHSNRVAASGSAADQARARLPLRAATEFDPGPAREEAASQIERRFARVANPDLVMTVFPHLAQGKYPVPGYVTAFPMYESVDYLLPGEASANVDGLR
jgi:conjugative transfer region lipoprotein (TIGR03751 family)